MYASLAKRMETFATYPDTFPVKACKLAEAGFRYQGVSDYVRCFYCGGGVKDWVANEDPWEEHVRWYPKCGFILQSKGRAYVDHYTAMFQLLGEKEVSRPTIQNEVYQHDVICKFLMFYFFYRQLKTCWE